jgi:hypothetical protein
MTNQPQDSEFKDNEAQIMRCPHDKQNPYVMINRDLIRDESISFGCRFLLIYLLSMHDNWKINPSQLINHFKPHHGRNAIYAFINEAIEAGYMKREIVRHPTHKNLIEKNIYYVSESPKFKKCFRCPENEDTENQDPENRDIKNNNHTFSNEKVAKEESSSKKKSDDDLIFNDYQREQLNNYSPEEISEALDRTHESCSSSKNSSRVKFFFTTLKNLKENPARKKSDPCKELTERYFKNGEFYNYAECHLTDQAIGFTRGMKHESLEFKYFSWDKFQKMCDNFGIHFKRKI